jgi:hypothetical protein
MNEKKSHRGQKDERQLGPLKMFSTRLNPEWMAPAKYYPGGSSQFIRESILAYQNNRHKYKFREILELISGELLILTAWKEKGHPGGAKWTEKEDQQLEYYERCFEILMNSPFAGKL